MASDQHEVDLSHSSLGPWLTAALPATFDSAQGTHTVAGAAAYEAASCRATVLLMDDRPVVPDAPLANQTYWEHTIALNALYARRHGYNFVLARPSDGPWLGSDGVFGRVGKVRCRHKAHPQGPSPG